jgi:hypothetical protein
MRPQPVMRASQARRVRAWEAAARPSSARAAHPSPTEAAAGASRCACGRGGGAREGRVAAARRQGEAGGEATKLLVVIPNSGRASRPPCVVNASREREKEGKVGPTW